MPRENHHKDERGDDKAPIVETLFNPQRVHVLLMEVGVACAACHFERVRAVHQRERFLMRVALRAGERERFVGIISSLLITSQIIEIDRQVVVHFDQARVVQFVRQLFGAVQRGNRLQKIAHAVIQPRAGVEQRRQFTLSVVFVQRQRFAVQGLRGGGVARRKLIAREIRQQRGALPMMFRADITQCLTLQTLRFHMVAVAPIENVRLVIQRRAQTNQIAERGATFRRAFVIIQRAFRFMPRFANFAPVQPESWKFGELVRAQLLEPKGQGFKTTRVEQIIGEGDNQTRRVAPRARFVPMKNRRLEIALRLKIVRRAAVQRFAAFGRARELMQQKFAEQPMIAHPSIGRAKDKDAMFFQTPQLFHRIGTSERGVA
ncbi:MAG: hypothetical protein HDKAJFGB_02665 [Anaerolineae bacterium]|nr:hypothetical protein [Anaerolineae bacterium]